MSFFKIEEDNVPTAKREAEAAWERVLIEWAKQGEAWAVEEVDRAVYDTPESPNYIRTGDLRKSIEGVNTVDEGEECAIIGSNMEYAPYVELGTSKMPPRPFIRPAVEKHMKDYARILMDEMEGL